ncbi:pyrophosphatase PpaX [mine drainage metagenome]|uniref:Pyrophosphatase PpaX n=1 Tax=mine drainage metagenome TaxID=410659 RepID=A0A1J5SK77_9ZZZZ
MPNQFDLIVWDWDGTIADSTGMIANAVRTAAETVGLPAITMQAASSIIGLGLQEAINTLYRDISVDQAQALAAQYRTNYYAGANDIPLFSGAVDTIIALNKQGFKLAVATGKGRRGLNLSLENSGLKQYFHETRTVDECFSKPNPQMLYEIMGRLDVRPERTLMIGDTSYDLQMAKNAGTSSVGVTFGAQLPDQWQHLNPIQQFNDFSSLGRWLQEYA